MQKDNSMDEVYSKSIKAGKRTYFIDIKRTKGEDHYITFTESKKINVNGNESFQKHKVFIYKEDFDKVLEGFSEVIKIAKDYNENNSSNTTTDIDFDDL